MVEPEEASAPADDVEGEGLDAQRHLAISAHPERADATVRRLTAGRDCVALDVDGRLTVEGPRDEEAAEALEAEARLIDLVRPALTLPVPDFALLREPRLRPGHAKLPGGRLLPADHAALPEPLGQTGQAILDGFPRVGPDPLGEVLGALRRAWLEHGVGP